ncbi:MAG: type IV pilin protein [Ideonella sp.]|jgi:type IV pilus assembly protein PilE|nr:type IV pilin protein [Ideonella sp.]
MNMPLTRARGFTLIELMVTVAIMGILVAVGFPSYQQHMAKGRRADGRAALVELAQRMERYYTERSTYATATLGGAGIYPSTSPQGHYTLAITAKTATTFTVQATPTGTQLNDACGSLIYNHMGDKSVSGGTMSAASCW